MKKNKKLFNSVLAIAAVVIAYIFQDHDGVATSVYKTLVQPKTEQAQSSQSYQDESPKLLQAFNQQQSKVWATFQAKVIKNLPDDTYGDKHQKFLVRTNTGKTLLISHNIDLAKRVPVNQGDTVWIRGRYEWNDKGGVIHWTHHDPKLGNSDSAYEGWIDFNGQRYE